MENPQSSIGEQVFTITKPVFGFDIGDQLIIGAGTPERYSLAVYRHTETGFFRIDKSGLDGGVNELVGYVKFKREGV